MQALDLYRAIQASAAAAPEAAEAEQSARALVETSNTLARARAAALFVYWGSDETRAAAGYLRDLDDTEARSELLETACRSLAPLHITFKHATGRIKLVNTRERLQAFAADMLKGSAWALWGGGAKPAETVKPRKARAHTWRPGLVKVAAEALQDGQAADFLAVALDQLGGRAYMIKANEAFVLYAADYAEGLPEGFAVARRCDGKWCTTHMPSGLGVGYAFKSKAQALESGRSALQNTTPEKLARALEGARTVTEAQHAEALAAWRTAHGLDQVVPETEAQAEELATETDHTTEAAPMSEDMAAIVATAAAVAIGTAQAQAAETCAPGATDPRAYVAAAAVDLERLTNSFNYDSTRRAKIEAGRRGELGALSYIVETLQRLAAQPGHSIGATEARKTLQRLADEITTDAQAMSDQAHQQCGEAQARTVRARVELLQILATLPETEPAEDAAELVTCDGPELAEDAAAVADTPAPQADAIGATDTPAETDAADCTQAPETLAQAGGYTQAPETLRADYLRAADAGHTQQAGSKTGAWSAAMFRTEAGRAGLAFKRPGHPVELVDCATGGERMRALQAMAQAAEQAHQQAGAAQVAAPVSQQAPDCTDPHETPAPDCTTPHETPAGAGALSIRLERWEGLVDECGQPVTVASFAEADALLMRWSETAPEHGGYNKCGFVITWPDGDTYTGRFDLMHHRRERPSLRDHISGQAEFWLGTGCPMHMGEQEYRQAIERATEETRAQWSAVLDLLRLHAAYFPRQQPVSCPDLRALAEHLKIEPAELVGLGVTTYHPSERNLQRGAITEAETVDGRWSGAPQLLAVVIYEDGTREHIEADAFKDHNNHRHTRRRLNLQRHGAPYLAQLAAAAAAQKAAASSAAERKEQAEKKARADLLEQFAHLERGGGCVVAARNMRALLKAAYPSVKFSVKTQQYSGGNNVTVTWTDGPTNEAVDAIVNRFKHGSFNGMDDSYNFNRDPFPELFGGCYYTHVAREESPELVARALVEFFPNEATRPSVQDWQNRRGLFDWRNVYTGREAEAYAAEFSSHINATDATPPAKTTRKGAKA